MKTITGSDNCCLCCCSWLTSQQHAHVSQKMIYFDNTVRCHAEVEDAVLTCYLTHSKLTPGQPVQTLDPTMPGVRLETPRVPFSKRRQHNNQTEKKQPQNTEDYCCALTKTTSWNFVSSFLLHFQLHPCS